MNNELTLTVEDIDRGWKEMAVAFRHGETQVIRLTAPDWRTARTMSEAFGKSRDSWDLIRPCLPKDLQEESFLSRLAPSSVTEIERLALLITYGEDAIKKNLDEATATAEATLTKDSSDSKPNAPAPASEMSAAGPSAN